MGVAFKIMIRNMFVKYIEGTIFEKVFSVLGFVFFILMLCLSIFLVITHFSSPKCKHGYRDICYLCKDEEENVNEPSIDPIQEPQILVHPKYIINLLSHFNLPPNTSDFEIVKKSYRKLVKRNHPDLGGTNEDTIEIISIYNSLKTYFDKVDSKGVEV